MIVNLPYHNLTVIDFNDLFVEEYQLNILDHLHKFNLLGKPLTNPDVKKIFYHNLIYSICKVLTKEYNSKPVLVFNNTNICNCSIIEYYNCDDVLAFLTKFIRQLQSMLPVKMYVSAIDVNNLNILLSKKDGKTLLQVNQLIEEINASKFKVYTFEKIKKFTVKYQLTFLTDNYFNKLQTKIILV